MEGVDVMCGCGGCVCEVCDVSVEMCGCGGCSHVWVRGVVCVEMCGCKVHAMCV